MKPVYVTIVGGTPKIQALDNNVNVFNVSIRTDATTVEVSVEYPGDSVSSNGYDKPVNPAPPVWVAAPAAVNGVIVLKDPVAAVRLTKAANGFATILQQGLR